MAGLDFISKLRPVSYTRNNDESKKVEYGFIAQEVEFAANKAGFTFSGVDKPKNEKDLFPQGEFL